MLEVNNLHIKEYVSGITFDVRLNSFKILYGNAPIFDSIFGTNKFDRGTVILENKKVSYLHKKHLQNLRNSIYMIPENDYFLEKRTLFENFLQISRVKRDSIIGFVTKMGLANSLQKKISQLSRDEVFRTKFLFAILKKPQILLAEVSTVEEETIHLVKRFAEEERFGVLLQSCKKFDETLFTEIYQLENGKIVTL
jgi:ABC-type ATPase involved in cell division